MGGLCASVTKAVILYDAAYEAYISDPDVPHSIYEIEGAREVAIEFRSLSKTAGFTGTRCAYTIIPKSLMAYTVEGDKKSVHSLWFRRHTTKFNGVSCTCPEGCCAIYQPRGKERGQLPSVIIMNNAKTLRESLAKLGL